MLVQRMLLNAHAKAAREQQVQSLPMEAMYLPAATTCALSLIGTSQVLFRPPSFEKPHTKTPEGCCLVHPRLEGYDLALAHSPSAINRNGLIPK